MKKTMVTRANAPNRKRLLFMCQRDLSKIVDFLFHLRDGEALHENVGVKERDRDQRDDKGDFHIWIDSTAARTDHGLRMLGPEKVDRQIIERNVDHSQ